MEKKEYTGTDEPLTLLKEVYRERSQLVAFLSRLYPSIWYTDEDESDYPVIYITLPTGQVSWHIHKDDIVYFSVGKVTTDDPWDGHTTEEKYRRLNRALGGLPKSYLLNSEYEDQSLELTSTDEGV